MSDATGEGETVARRRLSVDNYAIADGPRLGLRGWLRWSWRQVTSMRVALVLLLLLGIAAIPGSILPQWPHEPAQARAFVADHGALGVFLDSIGLLDVFGSAWFTAIYLLLFASLIGCIVPRSIAHARAMNAPLAPVPSSLARYGPTSEPATGEPDEVIARASAALRPYPGVLGAINGYRLRVDSRGKGLALVAERGHIRELGNLLFHISLVGILCAVGIGTLLTYRGQAVIVEGRTFTNAQAAYDSFSAGRLFNPDWLEPFTLTLDEFDSSFDDFGRPETFTAHVTLREPGRQPQAEAIQVNRPLQVHGGKIYLQGNGYAPVFTVRDADGNVAFEGAVPFLPQDAVYTSTGVIKVPDVTSGPQLGFKATLLPTAVETPFAGTVSIRPEPQNPVIFLSAFTGDLGLDGGIPQNVYRLDESQLSPVRGDDGQPLLIDITPGETIALPDGLGTVTWNSLPRFVALDLRADPSLPWLLAFAIGALAGLSLSLFGARRRLWLIAQPDPSDSARTLVEGAVLAPPHDEAAPRQLALALAAAAGVMSAESEEPHTLEKLRPLEEQ